MSTAAPCRAQSPAPSPKLLSWPTGWALCAVQHPGQLIIHSATAESVNELPLGICPLFWPLFGSEKVGNPSPGKVKTLCTTSRTFYARLQTAMRCSDYPTAEGTSTRVKASVGSPDVHRQVRVLQIQRLDIVAWKRAKLPGSSGRPDKPAIITLLQHIDHVTFL